MAVSNGLSRKNGSKFASQFHMCILAMERSTVVYIYNIYIYDSMTSPIAYIYTYRDFE